MMLSPSRVMGLSNSCSLVLSLSLECPSSTTNQLLEIFFLSTRIFYAALVEMNCEI